MHFKRAIRQACHGSFDPSNPSSPRARMQTQDPAEKTQQNQHDPNCLDGDLRIFTFLESVRALVPPPWQLDQFLVNLESEIWASSGAESTVSKFTPSQRILGANPMCMAVSPFWPAQRDCAPNEQIQAFGATENPRVSKTLRDQGPNDLRVASLFFPGILLSRKQPKTLGNQLVF